MVTQAIVIMRKVNSHYSIELPSDFVKDSIFPLKPGDKINLLVKEKPPLMFGKSGPISKSIVNGSVGVTFEEVNSRYHLNFPIKEYPIKLGNELKAEIENGWVTVKNNL